MTLRCFDGMRGSESRALEISFSFQGADSE